MSLHDNVKQKKKNKKKRDCRDNPPSEVNPCPRYTVNITPTEQTGGAAYPEANLNTKIGRKIVGDSGATIFNCRPLHIPKIRWCPRAAARKRKQIRVFAEASVIEKRLPCGCIATQKVSAVSGRVKKEEDDDNGGRERIDGQTDRRYTTITVVRWEGRGGEGGDEEKERRNVPCKHGSGCLPQRQ